MNCQMQRSKLYIATLTFSLSLPASALDVDIFDLSLEELLEVEVSSRRFKENFRDVARSVSVITDHTIDNFQIDSIYDLALITPNLSIRRNFGRWQERPVVRGISSINGEPPAGILIDGMLAKDIAPTLSMHDISQVEILRGPEAALFGRSTFSGAINFISRRTGDEDEIELRSRAGDNSFVDIDLWANKTISSDFSMAFSGRYYSRDNLFDNSLGEGGGGYGEESSEMASLLSTWVPSETLSIFYKGTIQRDKDGHVPTYVQNSQSNNCFLDTSPQYFCGEIETPSQLGYSRLSNLWEFKFDKDIQRHFLELSSNSQNRDFKFSYNFNSATIDAWLDADLYELNSAFTNSHSENDTHNVDIFSNFYFSKARILFGAAYTGEKNTLIDTNAFLFGGNLAIQEPSHIINEVDNYAIFSSLDYKISTSVTTSFDLRYAIDEVAYETPGSSHGENTWYSLSPRLNIAKTFENKNIVFLSVSRGNKPGGFNSNLNEINYFDDQERDRVLSFLNFDEESITSYNLGFKGEVIQNHSFINASIFFNDWKNMQLTQSLSYLNENNNFVRTSSIVNGGTATSTGLEIEIDSTLTPNIQTNLGLGYVISEFDKAETAAQNDLTGSPTIDGKKIPNTPETTAHLGVSYTRPIFKESQLSLHSTLTYESSRYVAEHNLAKIGTTTKLNITADITYRDWEFSVWGKNLNDDDTPESSARFGDAATFFVRRAFGISLPETRQVGISVAFTPSTQ